MQLGQRDHLHVHARRLGVGRDEAHTRRGLLERVQHPGLGRHHRLSPRSGAIGLALGRMRVAQHAAGGQHVHAA